MRILITSIRPDLKGGTQLFWRDLARGLQKLGHSVVAYNSSRTPRGRLPENDGIPVAACPEDLPFLPEVIHAHHHLDAMTALMALPDVPAVYHCGNAAWQDWAPRHPRIHRYLAMSGTHAGRMAGESGIDPSDISVFLNPVDPARFRRVRKPPVRPRRALFFNGRHDEDSDTVAAIREAAVRSGLDLDFGGGPFGKVIEEPHLVLPEYDIVFASGRPALEALACGCAVVVLGRTSCGEMVLPENVDRLRQDNFSIAPHSPPPVVETIEGELRRYSPEGCASVTERVRQAADLSPAVRELEGIYERVMARHRGSTTDFRAEMVAVARYYRRIVPQIMATEVLLGKNWMSPTRACSFDELDERIARIELRLKESASKVTRP